LPAVFCAGRLSVYYLIALTLRLRDGGRGKQQCRFVIRIFVVFMLGLTAVGCASVTRGTTDQLQILSSPQGAQAHTSMGYVCVTPCTLQANRKDEFTVTFSKPGFHSAVVAVKSQVGGAGAAGFAGNILIGGVVGMVADAATGATLEHVPNPVSVTLIALKKGETPTTIKTAPQPTEPTPEEPNPKG
jgi:hypothetical protein